ncbi:MAG: hypothetical protein EOO06_19015 [Chitinophagaceae bacterium]|nr:MAG: hypothetical protein EOO06_19015 [Chitinophagaceae bacterium]
MKLFTTLLFCCIQSICIAQVGIGTTTPDASARLEVSATTQGFLPPRMTSIQRDAIGSPAAGLVIFNTTSKSLEIFDGISWTGLVKSNDAGNGAATRKLYGGDGTDQLYSVQAATDGGYFFAGIAFPGTASGTLQGVTPNGNYDIWVLKTDASLNIEWQRLLGGTNYDQAYTLTTTADGGCMVAGNTFSPSGGIFTGAPGFGGQDALLVKLTATGAIQWYKVMGGTASDQFTAAQQTADGGYIVTGSTFSSNSGTLTGVNTNGSEDGWIAKLDAAGTLLWQKLMGGSGQEKLACVQQTADGGYVFAGYSASSNTGTLIGVTNNGSYDVWVVKTDANGLLQWQKLLGGSAIDAVDAYSNAGIKRTADGGYIVAAYAASTNTGTLLGITNNGSNDAWIIKLDGFGNLQWQKLLGGTNAEYIHGLAITADGKYVFTGGSTSSGTGTLSGMVNNGGTDAFLVELDAAGNLLAKKLIGGNLDEYLFAIIATPAGFTAAGYSLASTTGYFAGFTGNGNADGWLIKLDKFLNTY